MNAGRISRYALVSIVASTSLLVAGCGPKDSGPTSSAIGPTPTSTVASATPSASAAASGMAIQGETAIGALGDPCALLTAAEVEAGTGYHVTGITRGTITTGDTGPSQNCVFLTDGPSLVGPLASALGAMSGQDPTAVSDAVNAAGGLVGVTLMPTFRLRGFEREREGRPPTVRRSRSRDSPPPLNLGRFAPVNDVLRHRRVPPAGFEPATAGLEVRCSIHLSYEGGSRVRAGSAPIPRRSPSPSS